MIGLFLASNPYSLTTKRTYEYILQRLTGETDPATVTAEGLLLFVNKPEWGGSRRCVALAAAKMYLAFTYGHLHPALSAKLKPTGTKPQRALSNAQAIQLLASFDPHTEKGVRDLAICSLALDTGLRVSELCRLQQSDTDTERNVLQVIVKGGQWEAAVFTPQTAAHIEAYLLQRKHAEGGYLFVNSRGGKGLTAEGLQTIVKEWGKLIGIKLSPHDLRRTFAVISTLNGAPERVLMAGGRWSSSQMVNRYTRTLKLEAMRRYLPMTTLETP